MMATGAFLPCPRAVLSALRHAEGKIIPHRHRSSAQEIDFLTVDWEGYEFVSLLQFIMTRAESHCWTSLLSNVQQWR